METIGQKHTKVLVACEESQVVTKAFRALGFEAWSCDILPSSGGKPEWHIQDCVENVLADSWGLVLAFPPCTHLCSSGARWFKEKREDGRQKEAIEFFMLFTKLCCPWAIENPVGIMSSVYRKPDQIIQPHFFGHGESKKTCLWLNKLPPLYADAPVSGREQRVHKLPPSSDRSKIRSKTYPGVARAMAQQWGKILD